MATVTPECPEIVYLSGDGAPPKVAWRWARACRRLALAVTLAALVGTIAAVVVGGVVPALHASRRARCHGNLKQLGLALAQYQDEHGHFPAPSIRGRDGTPLLSWRVEILPRLGYHSLYQEFHRDEPWDSPHNLALLPKMPPVFACPAGRSQGRGRTGYRVAVGPKSELGSVNTPFDPTRGVDVREILDGTSATILVAETESPVPWTKPEDLRFEEKGPPPGLGSGHPGGFNVALADGSIRFIKTTIESGILRALFTINGGEVVSSS